MLGEKVVPMGSIAYAFSEEGAGIDGKSFSLLPVEIFYRETGKTKKVTEYPCDGKLLKAAEQVKTKYHTGRGVIGSGDEWNNQLDRIALFKRAVSYSRGRYGVGGGSPALPFLWSTVSWRADPVKFYRKWRKV